MPTFDLADTPPTDTVTHASSPTNAAPHPSSPESWDDLPTQEIPAVTMRELVFGLGSHPDLQTRLDQQALDTLTVTTLTQDGMGTGIGHPTLDNALLTHEGTSIDDVGIGHQAIGPDRATRDMRPLSRQPTEAMVPLETATSPAPGDRRRSDKITLPYVFVVPDTFEVTDVLVGEDGFVSTELSDGIPQVEGGEATQPSIYTTVISRVA